MPGLVKRAMVSITSTQANFRLNGLRSISCHKCMCIATGAVLATLLTILLYLLYMAHAIVWPTLQPLIYREKSQSFLDAVKHHDLMRTFLGAGKDGGFLELHHETFERIFALSRTVPSKFDESGSVITFYSLDVSHDGEALYVYKRILSRADFPFERMVVDIGANDGLFSSNSFNFIQWGWDAVLVEPMPNQMRMAKNNTKRYIDPYGEGKHKVHFEQSVVSTKDGFVDLVVTHDVSSMQNHLIKTSGELSGVGKGEHTLRVQSVTVKTLAEKYKIPKYFGILSIDTEGVGDKILHQWIDLGYRPAYIIYEALHNDEDVNATNKYLHSAGYTWLSKLGYNEIYEYRT